ncbi:MAG: maleylpyruvate isomerase family mycothiol-dependent enzyme [Actinomycetota bacterium]|nr:maleylpyruvate isomerase family mycothiol-dependent enzyme [Actinomycetota bacterium]
MTDSTRAQGLAGSTLRLVRTVDGLSEQELAEPSLLPGWRRSHVVAHLVLNAEGLTTAMTGLRTGNQVPMYASDRQRDDEIDQLAAEPDTELRGRLLAATTSLRQSFDALTPDLRTHSLERVPGGPVLAVEDLPTTRRREVEIHHADLNAGYSASDWPPDFCLELLDVVVLDQAAAGPFRVEATDLGRDWVVGTGEGPTVSGPAAAMGWWLTGRGSGEGLASDSGVLPRLRPWRRTPAR